MWGDPAFYDSTIRVVDALVERYAAAGVAVEPRRHRRDQRTAAARRATPHPAQPARRASTSRPGAASSTSTTRPSATSSSCCDGHLACAELADAFPDLELYWGAYLGTPDELLVHGTLADVIDEVRRLRAAGARAPRVGHGLLPAAPAGRCSGERPGHQPSRETDALTDGVVTLRPVTAGDWEVVRDEHNDEESLRWDFEGRRLTDDDARRQPARAALEWRRGRAARFVMVDVASGEGAGVIGVLRMGPPGTGLVGYGVLPAFRGRGFTTRALRLVSAWAFEVAGLARLELGHKVGNVASGKAAAKAGFRMEGRLSARLPNPDGTRSDEIYYSLVPDGRPDDATTRLTTGRRVRPSRGSRARAAARAQPPPGRRPSRWRRRRGGRSRGR